MYNSIFVSMIVKVWGFIVFEYNRSFLKKTIKALSRGFSYLSNGSSFKSILISRDSFISKSFVYSLYITLMNFINKILKNIRNYIKEKGKHSLIYNNIHTLFQTKIEVLRTFFIFTLSFGIGLAVNNIIRGYYSGKSYIVVAIIAIGSIVGLSLKENYRKVIKNSLLCQFIYSIFSIEEGLNRGD